MSDAITTEKSIKAVSTTELAEELVQRVKADRMTLLELSGDDFKVTVRVKKK